MGTLLFLSDANAEVDAALRLTVFGFVRELGWDFYAMSPQKRYARPASRVNLKSPLMR